MEIDFHEKRYDYTADFILKSILSGRLIEKRNQLLLHQQELVMLEDKLIGMSKDSRTVAGVTKVGPYIDVDEEEHVITQVIEESISNNGWKSILHVKKRLHS